MYPQDENEVKVKVATRHQTLGQDPVMLVGLLLVIVSVVVLIGRSAGGM